MTIKLNHLDKTFGDFLVVQQMPSFVDAHGSKRKLWLGRCTSCATALYFSSKNLKRTPNQKCPLCTNWKKYNGEELFKKTK